MQDTVTTLTAKKNKDDRQKPNVVVPISKHHFEQFLQRHVNKDWPFCLDILEDVYETDDLVKKLNDSNSEVLLTAWSTKRLPEDIMDAVPSLQYVAHVCGSVRGIIPRNLIQQGLIVTNWGELAARTVAEHCLLQVLSCLRKAAKWQLGMHMNKVWGSVEDDVFTLFDKKVGIHGFGVSAREFVKLIKPFGCKISAYSPHVDDECFREYGIERSHSLEELFSEHEIIVDLAALTPKTKGIVTEELLNLIPDRGVFINAGRGAVVDEWALAKVAKTGRIQIALDVYETEPLPEDSPLRGCENVFITPHIAGPTVDERPVFGLYALNNIKAYFEKKPLKSVVDLARYDRMT